LAKKFCAREFFRRVSIACAAFFLYFRKQMKATPAGSNPADPRVCDAPLFAVLQRSAGCGGMKWMPSRNAAVDQKRRRCGKLGWRGNSSFSAHES
jgi:hypothetical protein